jgi:hypothetical protein
MNELVLLKAAPPGSRPGKHRLAAGIAGPFPDWQNSAQIFRAVSGPRRSARHGLQPALSAIHAPASAARIPGVSFCAAADCSHFLCAPQTAAAGMPEASSA